MTDRFTRTITKQPYRLHPDNPANVLVRGEQPFVHVADLAELTALLAADPMARAALEHGGVRTVLMVPLRKDKTLLGIIACAAKFCRSAICLSVYGRTSGRLATMIPQRASSLLRGTAKNERTPTASTAACAIGWSICGLRCEAFEQRNLFVGEQPHLVAAGADEPEEGILLAQRHVQNGSQAGKFDNVPQGR
jgi:hypothetical protein